MRVFVLLSRIPYPLEKGDKLRAYHQVKALHEKHEVFLCCLHYGKIHPQAKSKLREISSQYKIVHLSYLLLPFYLLMTVLGRKPLQVGFFFQLRAYREVRNQIAAFKPEHIYAQLIRTAEYVKGLHSIKKTLDYQDAFSASTERREKKSGFLTRPIWRMEKERLRSYENIIFEYFEHKTIISKQDQQAIVHPRNNEITVVANGVDLNDFKPSGVTKDIDILFTGNMAYPPNVETSVFLVNEILPLIQKRRPNTTLSICGANPSTRVQQLRSQTVNVTGWVDHMTPMYQRSRIFSAPMQMGAGLQNKLLEALACGLPCITSDLAANALIKTNDPPYLIGRTPEDYANKILELLTNTDLANDLAERSRSYVLEHYSWSKAVAPLLDLISEE